MPVGACESHSNRRPRAHGAVRLDEGMRRERLNLSLNKSTPGNMDGKHAIDVSIGVVYETFFILIDACRIAWVSRPPGQAAL